MFGYELVDLILFDFETLADLYRGYAQQSPYFLFPFVGLHVFTLLFCFLKRSSLLCGALALAWSSTGYLFLSKELSSIYWPAHFIAYFCYIMTLLLIGLSLMNQGEMRRPFFRAVLLAVPLIFSLLFSFTRETSYPFLIGLDPLLVALVTGLVLPHSPLSFWVRGLAFLWLFLGVGFLGVLYFYV